MTGVPYMMECRGVWKIYNEGRPHEVRALVDINIAVRKGSLTVLTGPSGSGKTTLVGIMGTIERPSRGRVYLEGREITGFSDVALSMIRRERTGLVFQNFNLLPGVPAWENVAYPLIPQGVREGERRRRAVELLSALGLAARVDHPPEELSGGEQQRVAIARALVNDPDMIILDEPTSNIDAGTALQVLEILKGLKREGKTLILSTHDSDLFGEADEIYRLKGGVLEGGG